MTTPTLEKSSIPWVKIVVWGVIIVFLAVFGLGLLKRGETRPQVGDLAPDFELRLFAGYYNEFEDGKITLSDLRGRVVVINFWASWCIQCRVEAEELEQAWQQYRDRGVVFIGIDYDDTEVKAVGYLESFGVTYPNGLDGRGRISGDGYHITGVPETFIVDPSGAIFYVKIGAFSLAELRMVIEQALTAQ
jgi:cytochrome c biogenesis protein CcmG/thiol:disulfide interchange protein DsbE